MKHTRPSVRTLFVGVAALSLVAGLAACGGDDDDDAAGSGIEISGAWARTSPAMASAGAVYMELSNGGDAADELVSASVDASVAGKVELHETVEMGEMGEEPMDSSMASESMGSDSAAPMMEMRPVEGIEVPAGGSVALEPGGFHIMLLELAAPLEVGDKVEVTLTFAEAGEQVVEAEVRDSAP